MKTEMPNQVNDDAVYTLTGADIKEVAKLLRDKVNDRSSRLGGYHKGYAESVYNTTISAIKKVAVKNEK